MTEITRKTITDVLSTKTKNDLTDNDLDILDLIVEAWNNPDIPNSFARRLETSILEKIDDN